jgi:hypothetical protein
MQPIFSRNADHRKIAFMNWRMDGSDISNILCVADGYMLGAIKLTKSALTNNRRKEADILIFPILMNANHAIELYLKGTGWILNKLLDSKTRIEGGHNIHQLFRMIRSKYDKFYGSDGLKEFDAEMVPLSEYLEELVKKIKATPQDDKMDFARYPLSRRYENHFYSESFRNVEVDLENLRRRLKLINHTLKSLSDFMYHQELNHDW